MGVDEALLGSVIRRGPPTLRFYSWQGPMAVPGLRPAELAPGRRLPARRPGVGWCAASTGGGAVLHGSDLTYAVAAPEALLPDGLRATYAADRGGLVAGLRSSWGSQPERGAPEPPEGRSASLRLLRRAGAR